MEIFHFYASVQRAHLREIKRDLISEISPTCTFSGKLNTSKEPEAFFIVDINPTHTMTKRNEPAQ